MTLLKELSQPESWQAYLTYKKEKSHLPLVPLKALEDFIQNKEYLDSAKIIQSGSPLMLPKKILLNKIGSNKKRVVYQYPEDFSRVLKLLSFLLHRYPQPKGCYSFAKDSGAHSAIRDLLRHPGLNKMVAYKVDIHNYFNSIDIPILLEILQDVLRDDLLLYQFFERMLSSQQALYQDEIIEEPKGIMAGTPTAPFLANLYLRELDDLFVKEGIPYARYSDDIIVFAKTLNESIRQQQLIAQILDQYHLTINPDKEVRTLPGETWSFLGMGVTGTSIDLSKATKDKLKGKIRRKARSLYRWKLRKKASTAQVQRVLIRTFNKKFFSQSDPTQLTWSRWFFPLLTKDDGLREMDHYLQQYCRYLKDGHFHKKSYDTSYKDLKQLNYQSLVHAFFEYQKERK